MPGMNKSSRTIRLIESSLHRLESDPNAAAIDALGALDELRRLERKWREQVTAGSPRRIDADFRTMEGWLRRWLLATKAILNRSPHDHVRAALAAEVEKVRATLKL